LRRTGSSVNIVRYSLASLRARAAISLRISRGDGVGIPSGYGGAAVGVTFGRFGIEKKWYFSGNPTSRPLAGSALINWAAPASSGDEPEPARPAMSWNRTKWMDEAARAATHGVSDTVTADADWERLTYITERIAALT
jgi:hypothetical protein